MNRNRVDDVECSILLQLWTQTHFILSLDIGLHLIWAYILTVKNMTASVYCHLSQEDRLDQTSIFDIVVFLSHPFVFLFAQRNSK